MKRMGDGGSLASDNGAGDAKRYWSVEPIS
jgi:hypothetical protein